jgi:hypothetical protein
MSGERDRSGGVPAWLVAPLAGVVGFALAPPLVKAAVVAVVLGVVLVFALAHGHGMTLRAATALYAGRAVLALAKALAIVTVEWPLRGAHRVWVRYDAPLHVQLAASRAGVATRTAGTAALARVGPPRPALAAPQAEVLALPTAAAQPDPPAAERLPLHRHDGTTAA